MYLIYVRYLVNLPTKVGKTQWNIMSPTGYPQMRLYINNYKCISYSMLNERNVDEYKIHCNCTVMVMPFFFTGI